MTDADTADPRPGEGLSKRGEALGKAWVVGIMVYAAIRSLLIGPTLGPYGLNPWIFFAFDVGLAYPFAHGQVRIIQGLKVKAYGKVQAWTAAVTVSFLAPYTYLLLGAERPMPPIAYYIIGGFVVLFGVVTVLRIRQKIRASQAASE